MNWFTEYVCSCGSKGLEPVCRNCGSIMRRTGYQIWGFMRNNGSFRVKRRKEAV